MDMDVKPTLLDIQCDAMIRHDAKITFCPCPVITAYWTPPPVWPRRILCESKTFSFSLTKSCWCILLSIVLLYFTIMDVFLFARYRLIDLVEDSKSGSAGERYSPFTHLSVKAVLSDHVRHYLMTPTAEYFNSFTNFSSVVSVATPNVISCFHLLCAFIAGKFIASENLQDRQLGVCIYFFRTWLDSFDGTVFRSRQGVHLQYNSVYTSAGYFIDGLVDTLGGCFLTAGVLFYLLKQHALTNKCAILLPLQDKECRDGFSKLTNGHSTTIRKDGMSYQHIIVCIVGLGVCLSVTGICWDRTVKEFTHVFQEAIPNRTLSTFQFALSKKPTTMFIFFFWRFLSGQTVLTYTQIAIYMDKISEFLHYAPWILLALTIPLYIWTVIYIQQLRGPILTEVKFVILLKILEDNEHVHYCKYRTMKCITTEADSVHDFGIQSEYQWQARELFTTSRERR